MIKITKVAMLVLLIECFCFSYAITSDFNNSNTCLITADVGIFIYDKDSSFLLNKGAGVVGHADHFDLDHTDSLCEGDYSKNIDVSGLARKERFKRLLNVKVLSEREHR